MRIKMLTSCNGASNPEGSVSMNYKKDETYEMSQEWQIKVAHAFLSSDLAMEIKDEVVKEDKKEDKKASKKKSKLVL